MATTMPAGVLNSALDGPRIAGLDFLRALAVMLVLLDHSGIHDAGFVIPIDGSFGVTMFFVISGFLITKLLLDEYQDTGGIGLMPFYRRRAARLLPVFYAYLLTGLAILLLWERPVPWGAVFASAGYYVNYYQGLTGGAAHYLSHCWSLAVEEQFYVLWPFALLAMLSRRMQIGRILAAVIMAVWLLKFVMLAWFDVPEPYVYRALETRADQLSVGCLLALLLRDDRWRQRFETWSRSTLTTVMLLVALLASLTFTRSSMLEKHVLGYSMEPILVALLIPAVIVAASAGRGLVSRAINASGVVVIGQISYGMYLIHPFVMHPVRNLIQRTTGSPALGIALSILVVIGVAYLSFRWFEQPLRHRLAGHRNTPTGVLPAPP